MPVASRQSKRKRATKTEPEDVSETNMGMRSSRQSARLQTIRASGSTSRNAAAAASATSSATSQPAKKHVKKTNGSAVPAKAPIKDKREMTEAERKEDRARRNRASALKSRNKRRQRLAYLEVEYKRLIERIHVLETEAAGLKRENATLREQRMMAAAAAETAAPPAQRRPHSHRVAPKSMLEPDAHIIQLQETMPPPTVRKATPTQCTAAVSSARRTLDPVPLLPFDDFLDFNTTVEMASRELALTMTPESAWSATDDAVLDVAGDISGLECLDTTKWDPVDLATSFPASPRLGCGASTKDFGERRAVFERMIST